VLSGTNQNEITTPDKKVSTEWETWARQLNRLGLSAFAATLLESGGAFATLAAQSIYISKPLANTWISDSTLRCLANLLEDPGQSIAFASLLREQAR
jgi:hypothetical protein